MADKVTLVFVARVTLYTVIIVGAVLGVDALALSQSLIKPFNFA